MRAQSEIWSAARATAADRHTIEVVGIPSPVLMERAALAVAFVVQHVLRANGPGEVVVLCGPGNNGGDGLAVARLLIGRGVAVRAFLLSAHCGPSVAAQRALATGAGVTIAEGPPSVAQLEHVAIIVDAMLGTGARGAPRGAVAAACATLSSIRDHGHRVVAIDIPTGVDPDRGSVHPQGVRADYTVTIHRSKAGLHVTPGREYAGAVTVAEIGLVDHPEHRSRVTAGLIDPRGVWEAIDERRDARHKGERGHVACIGGSAGTAGALLLSGIAALRAGAGLVTLVSPDASLTGAVVAERPELMVADTPVRATALVIGPGLTDPDAHGDLASIWRDDPRPAVWDAGGLAAVVGPASADRILTPHPKEAAEFLSRHGDGPWDAARVQGDRLASAELLSQLTGAVVVLKGVGTVVSTAERVAVCTAGSSALATAGSGDCLAGVIAAFLARGLNAWDAACAGVHVHARAGERLGRGPGPLALDIADEVGRLVGTHPRDQLAAAWPRGYAG